MNRLTFLFTFAAGLVVTSLRATDFPVPPPDPPTATDAYYSRHAYDLPPGLKLEGSGLAVLPNGKLAVAIRKGEVWLVDSPTADGAAVKYTRFASGLAEPLGLTWHDGALYSTQRSEVTRMEDTDGDGIADVYTTAAKGWGLSGNYHEYAYGPIFDPAGNLWVSLNITIGPHIKLPGDRQPAIPWRGWAMMQKPGGKLLPVAAGLRSPFGLGLNLEGDVFVTDQQGNWWGTCPLIHLQPGKFYGHAESIPDTHRPESPVRDPGEITQDITVVEAAKRLTGFALPAVWFPYVKMGQSTTGIRCDVTKGAFGPFAGQMFVGEFTLAQVNRVFLEKVNGEYQGACFPFLDHLQTAVLQLEFLPDGSMVASESNRGWNSLGEKSFGLERIRWTGKTPFEVLKIEAQPDGFLVTFTEPLAKDAAAALTPEDFKLSSYTYLYHAAYGSPETDTKPVVVSGLKVASDLRSVHLTCAALRQGYVHEFHFPHVGSATGQSLLHDRAYYTLNQIPSAAPNVASAAR
jgi:glucose/arabinose dehydrogenase